MALVERGSNMNSKEIERDRSTFELKIINR